MDANLKLALDTPGITVILQTNKGVFPVQRSGNRNPALLHGTGSIWL